jgi:hypothetical protein
VAINLQTQSYTFSVLAAGTVPSRTGNTISDPTQPPPIASGGPSLAAGAVPALLAVVDVSLAEDPWRRTTRISVTTYDNTATYTYGQAGTPVNHAAASATLPVMLQAWAAAINAGPLGATAEAVDTNGDSVVDQLVVRQGIGVAPESVQVSATGSAVLSVVADADAATLDLYVRTRNAGTPTTASGASVLAASWRRYVAPGSSAPLSVALDRGGCSLQVAVAPDETLYPFVTGIAGVSGDTGIGSYTVAAYVAPCILPGSV